MTLNPSALTVGHKYRIVFKVNNVPREAVAIYLGPSTPGLAWSFRPEAGTAYIKPEDILQVFETSSKIKRPGKVTTETRVY